MKILKIVLMTVPTLQTANYEENTGKIIYIVDASDKE